MTTSSLGTHAEVSVDFRAHAYSASWRTVAAVLLAVSGASLPVTLLLVLLATDPPITTAVLASLVVLFALLPRLAARLVERAFAADVEVHTADLVLRRRGLRIEIPCAAIARVMPWVVPLPGPGFALRLGSGRRLPYGVQAPDPTPILLALADLAGVDAARAATRHPSLVYAHARDGRARSRWYHRAAKFVLFALPPTAVLFNAHQHIAYGALLGEYYLMGLVSYLETFAVYWMTVSIYLLLYASVLRGVGEAAALVAARVAPSRAARVRRAVETVCAVLYYGGVPILLGVRFLP